MDFRRVIIGLTALILTVGSSGPSGAAVPQRRANGRAVPARIQRPDRAQGNDQDRRVDIVTERGLRPRIRDRVLREAVPL